MRLDAAAGGHLRAAAVRGRRGGGLCPTKTKSNGGGRREARGTVRSAGSADEFTADLGPRWPLLGLDGHLQSI